MPTERCFQRWSFWRNCWCLISLRIRNWICAHFKMHSVRNSVWSLPRWNTYPIQKTYVSISKVFLSSHTIYRRRWQIDQQATITIRISFILANKGRKNTSFYNVDWIQHQPRLKRIKWEKTSFLELILFYFLFLKFNFCQIWNLFFVKFIFIFVFWNLFFWNLIFVFEI